MAKKGERRSRRISLDQAKAKQEFQFDQRQTPKERTLTSIYFSVILVTILLGAIVLYILHESDSPSSATEAPDQTDQNDLETLRTDYMAQPVEWTGKFPSQIIKEFRIAKTIDDRLKHLDHLDQIREEARIFFSSGPGSRETISNLVPLPPINTDNGESYLQLQAVLDSGDIRLLCVKPDPESPKIDFHAYARVSSSPWEDLVSGKVTNGHEMRIGIRPDNYYLGEFQDDSVWQSFRGITPDLGEHLSLYLRKENIKGRIEKVIKNNGSVTVTVQVRSVGNSHQRKQFEITKIHQFSWLTIPKEQKK